VHGLQVDVFGAAMTWPAQDPLSERFQLAVLKTATLSCRVARYLKLVPRRSLVLARARLVRAALFCG
jgi:hypothetical protein